MDFPFADFPELKYPLEKFEIENKLEEERILEDVRKIIQSRKAQGTIKYKQFDMILLQFVKALTRQTSGRTYN